ncbi:52 kDa repressor of the inhibitor of the protein kinase-like [Dendronephthya gigantea]|uniref:52 kDa repressor of the inhibitor of the protein kinase-like n=1 Tax=Dendronephthya gigantea TaxID=151771 RepID=UPI00106CC1CF|nr:52 kDa repressor of the inhibitor of the protein kinase-like [Dendronephthya gigantea]
MSAIKPTLYSKVRSPFSINDLPVLQECWDDIIAQIDAKPEISVEQLLDAMNTTNSSLSRNIGAEIYIPKCVRDKNKDKSCTAIRSEASGDCLYSSVSLVLVAEKPIANPTFQRKPNESFSSATSLAAHKLKQTSSPTTSATTSQKKPNESLSSAPSLAPPSGDSLISTKPDILLSGNVKSNFVHEFDVASYRERVKGMHSSEICNLVRNVFRPDKNFPFPKTNGRSFRYNWLELYPRLCYSPSLDGAFCLSCVLFRETFSGKASKISRLFSEPLRHWNDAAFTFKKHAGHGKGGEMGLHASTSPMLTAILAQISGAAEPIEIVLDKNLKKEIEENRSKLASIADAVLLCGRLGLPLRGHWDDSKYHPETSQDKIIKCFGQVISEQIVSDIKESKFFTIIADEAADSSHKEQMALVLRFVDKNMDIREEFIAFLQCKWGLSGENLAKLILDALNDLDLPIMDCRGQGYDGAGSVAGCVKGLAAQILKLNPKALYTHCYSHRLNLSVCDSLSIVEIKKMLKHVKEVTNFINVSQTRNMPFEETVRSSSETDSKKTRLPDVCRTRWVERVKGLSTFEELFVPVYNLLDDMTNGKYNPSLRTDASHLLSLISNFEFVAILVITRNIINLTLPVTQLLQGKSIDVMDGIELISSLRTSVVNVRNSNDSYHDQWYEIALALSGKVGVEEAKPRTVGRQTTRANHPYKTISEYYKRIITIPLIDHLCSSLDERFDIDSVNVYLGLSIIPTKMFSLIHEGIDWKAKFKTVSDFYVDDLPNPLGLDAELLLWQTFWEQRVGAHPSNIATTLKAVNFDGFENIKVILRILGTLPITSCECERSISALRLLKDYKRSTMVEERLNGLALMKMHQDIIPNLEDVIEKFSVHNTRLKFN